MTRTFILASVLSALLAGGALAEGAKATFTVSVEIVPMETLTDEEIQSGDTEATIVESADEYGGHRTTLTE